MSTPSVAIPNILVFGETGAGKSSVINMLGDWEGGEMAVVTSRAGGVTFDIKAFSKTIDGRHYMFYDTIGLNEGASGLVAARHVIEKLYKLIYDLRENGGVNLLVYVMRAPRIKDTAQQNYDLFYNIFCQKAVPIVIMITGLEDNEVMDVWWQDNKAAFDTSKMKFAEAACITAWRGRWKNNAYVYEEEYEQSRQTVVAVIKKHCAPTGWWMPRVQSYDTLAISARNTFMDIFGVKPKVISEALYNALKSYGQIPEKEAMRIANHIHQPRSSKSYNALESNPQIPEKEAGQMAQTRQAGVGLPRRKKSFKAAGQSEGPINIIIFGETGAGKSSVINMLQGETVAEVADKAVGVTFQNQRYSKTVDGTELNVFDTVGMNENEKGTVAPEKAIEQLYGCMRQLQGGINLLVYVVRGPRITTTLTENYELFFNIFCQKQVPIVLIVNGLESQDNMEEWWSNNRIHFERVQLDFSGVACITSSKGKKNKKGVGHMFEEEYEACKGKIEELITEAYLPVGWSIPLESWVVRVLGDICNSLALSFGLRPLVALNVLTKALKEYGRLDTKQAFILAKEFESRIQQKTGKYFVE